MSKEGEKAQKKKNIKGVSEDGTKKKKKGEKLNQQFFSIHV